MRARADLVIQDHAVFADIPMVIDEGMVRLINKPVPGFEHAVPSLARVAR
jgi:hypothetical protein